MAIQGATPKRWPLWPRSAAPKPVRVELKDLPDNDGLSDHAQTDPLLKLGPLKLPAATMNFERL